MASEEQMCEDFLDTSWVMFTGYLTIIQFLGLWQLEVRGTALYQLEVPGTALYQLEVHGTALYQLEVHGTALYQLS